MYLVPRFSIIWWSKSANCSMTEDIVVVLKEEYKNYLSRRIQDLSCISLNSIFNNNTVYTSKESTEESDPQKLPCLFHLLSATY